MYQKEKCITSEVATEGFVASNAVDVNGAVWFPPIFARLRIAETAFYSTVIFSMVVCRTMLEIDLLFTLYLEIDGGFTYTATEARCQT